MRLGLTYCSENETVVNAYVKSNQISFFDLH